MIKVERYTTINEQEHESLHIFLQDNEESLLPYHMVEFANVINEVFRYENLSLVALDSQNRVLGYLPQWRRGKIIESVPWRDKGGPVCSGDDILKFFIEKTKAMVKELNLKGFIWKGVNTSLLDNYKYFVNVEIDLTKYTIDSYWDKISFRVRNKIRNAEKNGLVFKVENENIPNAVERFYKLLTETRKRLGVPVYPIKLFVSYFNNFPQDKIKIFSIYKDSSVISSLIVFHNKYRSIDAYSASNDVGFLLKANDLMIYNVIKYCMNNEIKYFDFGADSPLQRSLIGYKLKWLGEKKELTTSVYGDVRESDHNKPQFDLIRKIIRKMPMRIYLPFSKVVIR
jgi:hypothetical protein